MPAEHSAGIIPFRIKKGGRVYLLLLANFRGADYYEFPKGLIEKGEGAMEAAVREFQEETGISRCEIQDGFKSVLKYFYRREGMSIFKTVTYFLGRVRSAKVRISYESKGHAWMTYKEAMQKIRFKN